MEPYETDAATMSGTSASIASLLPSPRRLDKAGGVCHVDQISYAGSQRSDGGGFPDGRVERAVGRWIEQAVRPGGVDRDAAGAPATQLRVAVDRGAVDHEQGYRLSVRPGRIDVLGGSAAGCFHGLQTLAQLYDCARGAGRPAMLPCCTIQDRPDFATRGLLYDVTRGMVPTLDTLKRLVDDLAALKVNQLQLYIEHAFVFSFDAEVCAADAGLTPGEVRELDAYCRERFVELVPAVATLGHMGRILSMPKYRHLAEIEPGLEWEQMAWPERVRGLTLDCIGHEAFEVVKRMWGDILECFSSETVNICGDEPWDLGRGRNKDRLPAGGRGEAYLARICATTRFCVDRGRRCQCWSDVLRNHRALLDRVPRDLTILHWGYDDRTDYAATGGFVDSGLDTVVCPGTSGWKRCINAIDAAERNIARFADAGRAYGASGLLNTDWGDHGHFNLLACSRHGIATVAARAWCADHPGGAEFDRRFARTVLGVDSQCISLLRRASAAAAKAETWRQLWMPLRSVADDPTLMDVESALESTEWAQQAMRMTEAAATAQSDDASRGSGASIDLRELAVACRFQQLWAEKTMFAGDARAGKVGRNLMARRAWADRLAEACPTYGGCWLRRNKASGLGDILAALDRAAEDVRDG
jgi:hypothetical protein